VGPVKQTIETWQTEENAGWTQDQKMACQSLQEKLAAQCEILRVPKMALAESGKSSGSCTWFLGPQIDDQDPEVDLSGAQAYSDDEDI